MIPTVYKTFTEISITLSQQENKETAQLKSDYLRYKLQKLLLADRQSDFPKTIQCTVTCKQRIWHAISCES